MRDDEEIKDILGENCVREQYPSLSCVRCKYGGDSCKRLGGTNFEFARPWFLCQSNGTMCKDFEPAAYCRWLKQNWVSFDDYFGAGNKFDGETVALCIDGYQSIRYYVRRIDFVNGTFVNGNGTLKWVKKQYYKMSRKSPTGYELVKEVNNELNKQKRNENHETN